MEDYIFQVQRLIKRIIKMTEHQMTYSPEFIEKMIELSKISHYLVFNKSSDGSSIECYGQNGGKCVLYKVVAPCDKFNFACNELAFHETSYLNQTYEYLKTKDENGNTKYPIFVVSEDEGVAKHFHILNENISCSTITGDTSIMELCEEIDDTELFAPESIIAKFDMSKNVLKEINKYISINSATHVKFKFEQGSSESNIEIFNSKLGLKTKYKITLNAPATKSDEFSIVKDGFQLAIDGDTTVDVSSDGLFRLNYKDADFLMNIYLS